VSLTPCGDLSAAAWITTSDLPWQQLVTFGPQEFPTYARLRFLPDPTSPGQDEPERGALDEFALLRIALDVLGEHTHTPEDVYFCMWDGWGTPPTLRDLPMVTVPNRAYFLIHGALVDFVDWQTPERMPTGPGFDPPPPAFIWPADHAWCLAFELDIHFAGIGATPDAITQLVAQPALDAVPAEPEEQYPYYA
jgi:hypothetical protein